MALEFGLLHQLRWLFARAAQEQLPPGGVNAIGEFANGAEARGVNGGHVAQSQNHDGRQFVQVFQNSANLSVAPNKNGPCTRYTTA